MSRIKLLCFSVISAVAGQLVTFYLQRHKVVEDLSTKTSKNTYFLLAACSIDLCFNMSGSASLYRCVLI